MRTSLLLVAVLAGCLHGAPSTSVSGAALGSVVIYRNGVAFYERHARTVNGVLTLHVARNAVDDFLKSLTVADPITKQPLAITIPRQESYASGTSVLNLQVATPDKRDADVVLTYVTAAPEWKPSYRAAVGSDGKVMFEGWAMVDNTSAEDWHRVLVGVGASSAMAFRYDLWDVREASRDLLSGDEHFAVAPPEGVSPYEPGSQQLEALADNEVAPSAPSPATAPARALYTTGIQPTPTTGVVGGVVTDKASHEALAGVTVVVSSPALQQSQTALTDEHGVYRIGDLPPGTYMITFYYADLTLEDNGVTVSVNAATPVFQAIDQTKAGGEVVHIKGTTPMINPDSTNQGIALDKNYLKNVPVPGRTFDAMLGAAAGSQGDGLGVAFSGSTSLENEYIADGANSTAPAPPERVQVIGATAGSPQTLDEKLRGITQRLNPRDVVAIVTSPSDAGRARAVHDKLVAAGLPEKRIRIETRDGVTGLHLLAEPAADPGADGSESDEPVGEAHFMAAHPMDLPAGTSAMVAMVHAETPGGVVYLYDPISDRGDKRFAFRAVQLENPTGDTLEPGPMTVYGDERFIGEGLTDLVPPHAAMVVPFAADRQIKVETTGDSDEHIARLLTVERGVVTAEMQERKTTHFHIASRLPHAAKVFLRYRLESGWTLLDPKLKQLELGSSSLFEVDVPATGTVDVAIAEAAPEQRTIDLSTDEARQLMKVYVDDPDADALPALRPELEAVLATHRAAAELTDKLATLRRELGEYRERDAELHAQIVTLQAVRAGGQLQTSLRTKLIETSNKVQDLTVAIADTEEQQLVLQTKLADQLAALTLPDATASAH